MTTEVWFKQYLILVCMTIPVTNIIMVTDILGSKPTWLA